MTNHTHPDLGHDTLTVWNFCTCSSDIVLLGKSTGGIAVFSDLFEILGHNILVCRQIMPYQTAGGKIKEEWAEVPSTIS